jgi:hypothetical protein
LSKYHSKRTKYNGDWYQSKREANYARRLELLRKALDPKERVVKVERQPVFVLVEKPNLMRYVADFRVTYADGRV